MFWISNYRVLGGETNKLIFRKDTLNLDGIFKETKVYFNHVKFTIENDTLIFSSKQSRGLVIWMRKYVKYSKQILLHRKKIKV